MSSIRIAVGNQKGGVAKTLLVDLDPQGQCASHLGMSQEACLFNLLANRPPPPLRDVVRTTGREGLYLLPGNKRTAAAQTLLNLEGFDKTFLATLFDQPRFNSGKLHFIVMDTAPSAGGLQEMAIYAADILILPAAVDFLALEGVAQILATLKALNRPTRPFLRVLPTFYDEVTTESQINLDALKERFGPIVSQPIHRAVALRECPPLGKTIFEHKPESRSAEEYASLVWEIIDATR